MKETTLLKVLVAGAILMFLCAGGPTAAQRTYYRTFYGGSHSNVVLVAEPRDCNWATSPMGNKSCHYDKEVLFESASNTVYVSWVRVSE
jgi:hypothetical protein